MAHIAEILDLDLYWLYIDPKQKYQIDVKLTSIWRYQLSETLLNQINSKESYWITAILLEPYFQNIWFVDI